MRTSPVSTTVRVNWQALRVIRELRQLSQSEVAAASDIDRPNYAHIEAGRRKGSAEQVAAIAEALRVPMGAIAVMPGEAMIIPDQVA